MPKPLTSYDRISHPNRRPIHTCALGDVVPDLPADLKDIQVNVEVWYDIDSDRVCLSVAAVTASGRGLVNKHKIDVRKLVEFLRGNATGSAPSSST